MSGFNMSKFRSAVNKYNSQVRKYNSEVRRIQSKQKQAINKYNSEVRRYNQAQRQAYQQLKSLLNKPLTVTVSSSVSYQLRSYEMDYTQADLNSLNLIKSAEKQLSSSADTVEYFEKGHSVDPMNDDPIYQKLNILNSSFAEEWRSACHALETDSEANPSFARHFGVSIRELITMILKEYAPDYKVESWQLAEFDNNGKPTRRTRFRYIFESHYGAADYLDTAVESAVSLCSVDLNKLTHTRDNEKAAKLAVVVKNQAISTIGLVLEALENR